MKALLLGGHMRANWRHNPCHLGVPKVETRTKMATQPLPCWVRTCGQMGHITYTVLGASQVEDKPKETIYPIPPNWLRNPCSLLVPKVGTKKKERHNTRRVGGPHASKSRR